MIPSRERNSETTTRRVLDSIETRVEKWARAVDARRVYSGKDNPVSQGQHGEKVQRSRFKVQGSLKNNLVP